MNLSREQRAEATESTWDALTAPGAGPALALVGAGVGWGTEAGEDLLG